jgi:hypothetical protein
MSFMDYCALGLLAAALVYFVVVWAKSKLPVTTTNPTVVVPPTSGLVTTPTNADKLAALQLLYKTADAPTKEILNTLKNALITLGE